MTLSIINFLNTLEDNSLFLFIIIGVISFLLILIFIFNYLSNRKIRNHKKYRKKLIEEINREAKNITPSKKTLPSVKELPKNEEEIEVLEDEIIEVLEEDDDVDRILNDIKKASKDDNFNLTEFEREQEETAIISYDELCKRAGVQKKIYKKTSEEKIEKLEDAKVNVQKKKYQPSKIVSPIYGVQEEKEEELDLDQTFLKSLKEFRSTLD